MHHNFLFDLDQTLLDFHASEHKALEIVLTRHGLHYTEDIYRSFKEYNKALWLELEKGTISRKELFTLRFTDAIRRCGGDPSEHDPLTINDEFIYTMSQNGVLMDGALELVKRIKEEIPGSRIYIISNGATINALGRIRSTGLDKYIDDTFISEDLGINKPAAAFFDIVLENIC
ncbi:MAG: HAD hydrolase-like protein, partial [Clostridiales bacterium]|nr:HAD hydrolase-like protein [Clostridiales bacterium]